MENEYLSPEQIEQLSQLGIGTDKLEELRSRFDRAKGLRYSAGPQGRMAGGVYTAANPLEHIGDFIGAYRGAKAMPQIQGGINQELGGIADARRSAMQAFLSSQRPGMARPPVQDPSTGAIMSPSPEVDQQQRMAQLLRGR